ncbi:tetratricopeptide repeat protein [Dyadobacter luticola]|uniref:histidine kinase n=1 Tax=Dyadobacter luticola TaxID=1979387 RepID=A0A5R9L5P8_9BACT|nr:tetratricopeptide repeat protein [Dyadobacter luticola]TLV03894.1 tetratricopeptide repeat protein [Dyadobacter luticola]
MGRLTILLCLTAVLWCFYLPDAKGQISNLRVLKEKQSKLIKNPDYQRDTAYLNVINQIAFLYADSYPDSALILLKTNVIGCQQASYQKGETDSYKITGNAYMTKGNFEEALSWYQKSYELAERIHYQAAFPGIRNNIGLLYTSQGNYAAALKEFYSALNAAEAIHDKFVMSSTLNNVAIIHFYQGKMDSADSTYKQTLEIAKEIKDTIGIILAYNNIAEVNIEQKALPLALKNLNTAYALARGYNNPEMLTIVSHSLGNTYFQMDSLTKAAGYFEAASKLAQQHDYSTSACKALIGLARIYQRQGLLKEALKNGLEALEKAKVMGHTQLLRDASEIVSRIYEDMGDGKNGLTYFKQFKIYSDSLRNIESQHIAAAYDANLEFSKKESTLQQQNLQQQWMLIAGGAALILTIVILVMVNRNRQRLDSTYKELQQKNVEIESQRNRAEEALKELKAAQAQLIQSEKMASLGEITAGIAHEIQNPLNFVNNFSETSIELLDEIKAELAAGNPELAMEIMEDVVGNLERIHQHGKRADSIVKGMLQHSRNNSGQKEPTDLNALIDEFVQLSYHGLRAKDKTFNSAIDKELDPAVDNMLLVPQDMGRLILNLVTNAFHAVQQRQNQGSDATYRPVVTIVTQKLPHKVRITVKDNGTGIPENIRNKIFQPFFTTKPTGQGTGLGLSLSYDIVTKGYGGSIDVQSTLGEGSVFTIELPG